MKILITGVPGSGKSLFLARFKANPKHRHFDFFDTDKFDYLELPNLIRNSDNCFVVVQAKKFLPDDIKFDRKYQCLSSSDKSHLTISDGFIFETLKTSDLVSEFYKL